MGRNLNRLSAKTVDSLKTRGYYADGGGLYLQISHVLSKSWVFRFSLHGKTREMGLGPVHTISLADARTKAAACRKLLHESKDPIEERKTTNLARKLEEAKTMTFKACATAYVESHRAGWKNEKHGDQWENTLETYAYPHIGALAVAAVDTGLVMKCLDSIWRTKPETASRLRGRIERVLDWATVRGYRTGDNPARWSGHLDTLLPARSKVAKVEHHAALPYGEIGSFMKALRGLEGIGAKALEFTILTATRTGEVIGAKWVEIDEAEKIWTVPAERMKAGKEHRVPLSESAMAVLRDMKTLRLGDYVFPGRGQNKALSNMAMLTTLKRMGHQGLTTHGFRSSFRDWASETTAYPREVAEMALAHAVGDKVEAAYRRGDLFEKRRRMMEDWAKYCQIPAAAGNVVPAARFQ